MVSIAAALLGAAVLCQPELAQAAPHGGGGGFHGGFGAFHGGFHGGGFHAGASTGAGSMVLSRACTTALPASTKGTGIMAGTTDGTAGGSSAPDWRGRTTTIRGGALIRIMTITTTASLTPAKPGTIAPIRQAITRM